MSKNKKNIHPKKIAEITSPQESNRQSSIFYILLLILITYLCFSNAFSNGFTNWDDNKYITNNPLIKSLSFDNIRNMFSTYVVGNYHPFAILSLAIDYHFYKLDPSGFHTTSILLHILNVVLVFLFIKKLSGKTITAFITALLFGIHPMHVESVAWVAERKDVLYVLFYISSLYFYVLYNRESNKKPLFYFLTFIFFIFSLLSKGQAVTLPIVLLLIDYFTGQKISKKIILEKIPFFIMSFIMGIVAIQAQASSGSIVDMPHYSLLEGILFGSFSFLVYIFKMILPFDLSAFYPYPEIEKNLPFYFYLSPLILLAVVYFIFRLYKTHKALVFGFGFYMVNIILLLQLLPVGGAIMAERYSYLSYVGLFFVMGYSINWIWQSNQKKIKFYKYIIAAIFFLYAIFLGAETKARNKVWKNDETLWTDVIKKYPNVALAYSNRGNFYQQVGKFELAMADYTSALNLKENNYEVLISRAGIYRMAGEFNLVIKDCDKAIAINKNKAGAFINRGIAKSLLGNNDEAMKDFDLAIQLEPDNSSAYTNRGFLFGKMEKVDEAISDYSKGIALNPEYAFAYFNRGIAYFKKGKYDAAILDFNSTISLNNTKVETYFYRSQVYEAKKDYANALQDALTAQQYGVPVDSLYINNLKSKMSNPANN